MVGVSHLKSLQHLHEFSMKAPCSSPNSMKMKTLIHSHIFQQVCQVLRALTKAKSMFIQLLNKNKDCNSSYYLDTMKKRNKRRKKKKLLSSIRFHYNWCSSHVLPMPEPVEGDFSTSHVYYDPTWNSMEEYQDGLDSQLSGYLHWLEEKSTNEGEVDEIDKLADKFIQRCHEKFRLEKQESYRRYQEMLARSM